MELYEIELTGLEIETLQAWLGDLIQRDEVDAFDRIVLDSILKKLAVD